MHDVDNLMAAARRQGIGMALEGGVLQLEYPIDEFDLDLLDQLNARAADIEAALTRQAALPELATPSFAQQRLWMLDRIDPGAAQYNQPVAVRLRGALDEAALRHAFDTIVARHEALRTRFEQRDGALLAVIDPPGAVALRRQRLVMDDHQAGQQAGQLKDRQTALAAAMRHEAEQPFDLGRDLLLRAALIECAPDDHVLLVTLHHIASDGWSVGIFVREFAALYAAFGAGRRSVLPAAGMRYSAYASWQRDRLQGTALASQAGYWRAQLDGLPTVHGLPLDHPRPPQFDSRGGRLTVRLDGALRERLAAVAQRRQATLFMVLQSAFAVLLQRYSGQDDIAIGTPVAGRGHLELEGVVGMFVNTLVLRNKVSTDISFEALLDAGRDTLLAALERQDIPFDMLVDELKPERSLSHMPLVQILFAVQERHTDRIALPGLRAEVLDGGARRMKFELETEVTLDADGMEVDWRYASALFEPDSIARLAAHFTALLHAVADDAQQALYQLAPLAPEDRQQLAFWNATTRAVPEDTTLANMVEAQAARTPHARALVYEGEELTYAELDRRASRLAGYLIDVHGVAPGARVGHCVARSIDMVVALLGIMKAGGAYVALDAGLPPERLAYMLGDSGAALLLAGRADAARLGAGTGTGTVAGVACVVLDEIDWERLPERGLPARCRADSLAYVIYTSGSTGRPKGTLNLHRGPCNRIHAMQRQFALTADDRVLQKTPLSFDVSVWEIFWPLSRGATLVLAAPDGHKDPAWLDAAVRRHGITVIHFVPSMLQMFLRAGHGSGQGAKQGAGLASLRYLMTSGEALSAELQDQCIEAFPGVELINHYGPTETGIEVSWWRFNAPRADRLVPIGAPLDNVRLYVLDRHDQQVPVGVAGELHIAGVQVGEGYLNQPELTAQRFVERVVDGRPEQMYRTGDRARWLADGQIEYIGRLDSQVKLFGVRFELGEIESHLRALPQVGECVVMMHGEHAAQRLACYVVPATPVEAGAGHADHADYVGGLRDALAHFLPGYILQATGFVLLDVLPLSPNGKVDRQALPSPAPAMLTGAAREVVAPGTPLARAMQAVWARHLALPAEQISVRDNFFEIGGNSLLSIAVQTDLRQELNLEVAVTDLFRYPTIEQLSRHCSAPPVATMAVATPPAAQSGADQGRARALQARARSLRPR